MKELNDSGGPAIELTVRDIFAAFATAGILAWSVSSGSSPDTEAVVEWAYEIADELLEQSGLRK